MILHNEVSYKDAWWETHEFTIHIDFIAETVEFVRPLKNINAKEIGISVTFECEVTKDGATAEWYKDGQPIGRSTKYQIKVEGKVHQLVIHDVDDADVEDYAIVVKGNKCKASLTVDAAPTYKLATKYRDVLYMNANQSAVIEVPFRGSPQPKVSWQFNGGALPDPRRSKVETIRNMTCLNLNRVLREDSGTYTLILDNTSGKVTADIKVVVMDKPGPPRNLANTEVTETSIGLKWTEPQDDGGCDITNYIIEAREGTKFTFQNLGHSSNRTFTALNLREGQSYLFRVSAENQCGVGEPVEMRQGVVAKSPHSKHYSDTYAT